MDNELIPKTIQEKIQGEIKELISGAEIETITDEMQFMAASELSKQIRKEEKTLINDKETLTQPLERKKKSIISYFKPILADFARVKKNLDGKTYDWQESENIRKAKEQAIEDERVRLEKEKMEKKAEKLEEKKPEVAEQIRQEADMTVSNIVEKQAEPQGVSRIIKWKYEITDIKRLIMFFIKTGQYEYLTIDEKTLKAGVKIKESEFKADGLRVYKDVETRRK